MYFSINGYWKDDNGLSELEIQASIANAGIEEDVLEFVITSYKIYTP